MFGFQMTEYDKKVYEEELRDFLPDKFIDIHNHVYKKEFPAMGLGNGGSTWPRRVAEDCTIEDLVQTFKDMFPGKTVIPNIFGGTRCEFDPTNRYIEEVGKKYGYPYMYRISYDMDPEKIEREVTEGGFIGFKPYLSNKPPYIPVSEVRIFDFLTHEHLRIADKLGLVVVLHMARDKRLRDPLNIAQLMEIEEKYPNVKLIVAHVGRAYTDIDIGDAFDTLKHTKNMLFDFSANTLDSAIQRCIEAVGFDRVLYGSDMPIAKMRMYRITEGDNYVNVVPRGLYGDVSSDVHMREVDDGSEITNFLYEELRAFKRVSQKLGLSREEIEKIMYGNAARVLNYKG